METVFNYAQTMLKSPVFKIEFPQKVRKTPENQRFSGVFELRGKDLNQRPPGYEPDELPNCSTPRYFTAGDRARTGTGLLPRDFKSRVSANSTTPAWPSLDCLISIAPEGRAVKRFFEKVWSAARRKAVRFLFTAVSILLYNEFVK